MPFFYACYLGTKNLLQAIAAFAIAPPESDAPQPTEADGIVAPLGHGAWLIAHDEGAYDQWRRQHGHDGYICNFVGNKRLLHKAICDDIALPKANSNIPKIVGTNRKRTEDTSLWIGKPWTSRDTCQHSLPNG